MKFVLFNAHVLATIYLKFADSIFLLPWNKIVNNLKIFYLKTKKAMK